MANRITTLFDFKESGSGLKKIKADIQGAEGAVGKFKAGWKGAFAEFKSSPASMAAAGAAVGAFATKAIGDASDLQESVNAVTVTYGKAADEVLKIGENSAKSFGLSKSEFNGMAVQFSSFVDTVAGAGGDVAGTLNDLTTRAADFASVMNLDVAEAARVFQSGLAGETEPLKKFGINLSAASVEAFALEKGLAASKSEMTEAIKVQARYQLLMELTEKTAGDFANTSDSLANRQRTLQATMTDLSAEAGGVLIPVVEDLAGTLLVAAENAGVLSDALDRIPGSKGLGDALGKGFTLVTQGSMGLTEALWEQAEAERAAADAARGRVQARRGAASKDADYVNAQREAKYIEDEATAAALQHTEAMRDEAKAGHWVATILGDVADETDEAGAAAKKAAKRVEDLEDAFASLNDEMSDRSAWLDVEDAAVDFAEAVIAAEEATAEFGAGSKEAEQANRDMERALIARVKSMQAYILETESIPDEVATDIQVLLDRGSVDEVEAILRQLERDRTARLRIFSDKVYSTDNSYKGVAPSASSGTGTKRPMAATGGIVRRRTDGVTLGEAGPEAVIPLDRMPGNSPLGNLGGGVTIHIGQITTAASNGQQLLDELTAAVRRQGPSALKRSLGI